MIISATKADLILPGATSLKAKRGPLKRLLSHIRTNFNCSCVEADMHDLHQRTQILFVLAGQDRAQLSAIENSLEKFLQTHPDFILSQLHRNYFSC